MSPFQSPAASLVFALCQPQAVNASENDLIKADPEAIMDFASRNGVAPWCYHQISEISPKEESVKQLIKKLRMQYLQTLLLNQQKWKVFHDMNSLAQGKGITIIPLKGTALAFSLYPQESLRPMGDIDILVDQENIFKLRDLLLQKGGKQLHIPISSLHEKIHAHIPALSWQNTMIEPHQRLFAMGSKFNLAGTDLFHHTIQSEKHPDFKVFDDIMQTYHLCAHTYKEYKMGGMRLGWLLDIALLLKRNRHDEDFRDKVMKINPKVKSKIKTVLQWSSTLLPEASTEEPSKMGFPPEHMFVKENNPEGKHKIMILHEIAGLPGLGPSAVMLFRELFPEKRYMDHQYGKHRGISLFKLYLKRIAGMT